jgi:hypothetical protein
MAVLTGLPLVACAGSPGVVPAAALWFLSGLFAAYQVEVITTVMRAVPEGVRGRFAGVVGAGLTASQGVGVMIFGLLGNSLSVPAAIAIAGGGGSAIAAATTLIGRGDHVTAQGDTTALADGRRPTVPDQRSHAGAEARPRG